MTDPIVQYYRDNLSLTVIEKQQASLYTYGETELAINAYRSRRSSLKAVEFYTGRIGDKYFVRVWRHNATFGFLYTPDQPGREVVALDPADYT